MLILQGLHSYVMNIIDTHTEIERHKHTFGLWEKLIVSN